VGWLKYFSDRSSEASFFLEHAAWVGADLSLVPIDGPGIFLTKESGICSVSFLNWEHRDGRMTVSTDSERLVRRQGLAIAQGGYAVSLILSLATASLGFSLMLIRARDFGPGSWGRLLIDLSVAFLVFSVCFGSGCVINRVRDFRETASIARDRRNWQVEGVLEKEINEKLQDRRARTDRIDKWTCRLFYVQTITFTAGIISLVFTFAVVYAAKLL
jgi:hypothetical protein